jgi:hypothetical protein
MKNPKAAWAAWEWECNSYFGFWNSDFGLQAAKVLRSLFLFPQSKIQNSIVSCHNHPPMLTFLGR